MGSKTAIAAGPSILVVEDNALIALDLETILFNCGVENVQIATSINQALALLEAEAFDAVFLDLKIGPSVTLPVAEALRAAGTPFAFATGYDVSEALHSGFNAQPVVAKPYSEGTIREVLKQLLHRA